MCSLGIEPTTFALLTQCSNHQKYTCNRSTLAQSNILQYIFSWTSAQLKCIKYNISSSNLADFKYASLVYLLYQFRIFMKNSR